jgi:uroporphyrinogen-III synthase
VTHNTQPELNANAVLPLQGLRVLVPRAAGKGDDLAERLRELGAEPLVRPLIAHAPPEDTAALDAALACLHAGAYTWLVVTSATTVEAIAERLTGSLPSALRIAAVGPATAAACERLLQRTPDALPTRFVGADLPAVLGNLTAVPVLLPNADIADPALETALDEAGAIVERVVAYRTVPVAAPELLHELACGIDVLLFTSGSTARAFAAAAGGEGLDHARRSTIACIGPSTAAVCRELGIDPDLVAEVSTSEGLLDALMAWRRE